MEKIVYFVMNNYEIPYRSFVLDQNLPLKIYANWFWDCAGTNKYLNFSDKNNIIQVKTTDISGHIVSLVIVYSDYVIFHSEVFQFKKLISSKSCAAITINKKFQSDKVRYLDLNPTKAIHVYKNCIIIITADLCPIYLLYEDMPEKTFSVITDKNFIVIGFIIWIINPQIIECFKDNLKLSTKPNDAIHQAFSKCESFIMENTLYLIKKIVELKNTNLINLLYYAYDKKLIDDQFLVDYAIYQLEKNQTIKDPFILELTGLLNQEINKAGMLLENQIKNKDEVLYEKGQYYNKIWFYLTLAADMCAEKIID